MKDINFRQLIIFENQDYLLVNKPPYVATLEDRASDINILSLAKGYLETCQIGHRLDKETSGILAIAKNPEAYRHLSMQFENRQVKKIYHAIISGIHAIDNLEIKAPIQIMSRGYVKISNREGKAANTVFNTLEVFKKHTLIECQPITGRMHQIRIHLQFNGTPIAGDTDYDGQPIYLSEIKKNYNIKKWTEEEPMIKRVALHAARLEFSGLQGEKIVGEAEYPKDFMALIKQLRKFN